MNSIEDYCAKIVDDLMQTNTFAKVWPTWKGQILKSTNNLSDPKKVFQLGEQLSSIFNSTRNLGRGQSAVSAAGNVWECLICWYLNLVFSGTHAIATRHKAGLVPKVISDAMTITYGTEQTNTESDIVVIIFPDTFSFGTGPLSMAGLSAIIEKQFGQFRLGIIQCKTNWNENSQIPMLWDMVYQTASPKGGSVRVGKNGVTISNMASFSYSFVTVPTQTKPIKATSMPVKRVRNLTGGNFWGKPTQYGVALCINEIFTRNYAAAFGTRTVPNSIDDAIKAGSQLYQP